MCTQKHWELCNSSPAHNAATKFALSLEETAKQQGYKPKTIRIRTKEQIIKGGFGKSDAQVIWKEGPKGWATNVLVSFADNIDYIVEKDTVSFYTR